VNLWLRLHGKDHYKGNSHADSHGQQYIEPFGTGIRLRHSRPQQRPRTCGMWQLRVDLLVLQIYEACDGLLELSCSGAAFPTLVEMLCAQARALRGEFSIEKANQILIFEMAVLVHEDSPS
jgi:hypothetical protein